MWPIMQYASEKFKQTSSAITVFNNAYQQVFKEKTYTVDTPNALSTIQKFQEKKRHVAWIFGSK